MTDVQPRTGAEIQQDRSGTASTRRVVLMGAGGLGVAAALAACGTDSSGTNPNGSEFNKNPIPAGSEGTTKGSSGGGTGNAAAGGTVLVAASKVQVGGGVILDDLVVTQPEAGTFKAFSKLCTHQGCPVSKIEKGQIKCLCHASDFDIATGAPTKGPAKTALAETAVTLDGDNIVTA